MSTAARDDELPSWDALLDLELREAKERMVTAFERVYVQRLLALCGGNVAAAARRAGVDRVTLFRTIKRLGLRATTRAA
jgi:transcriptional regulator of acetoin/glycerol metabolism